VEEHGGGRQLVRIAVWPRWSAGAVVLILALALLALGAAIQGTRVAPVALALAALALAGRMVGECSAAIGAGVRAVEMEP